ncbi:MAG: protein DpdE [Enhygromyxa sp.]
MTLNEHLFATRDVAMSNPFVESKDPTVRAYGLGKPVDDEGPPGRIRFFVSPAEPAVERVVAAESIFEVELNPQERVFFRDGGAWRVGRFEAYTGPEELGLRLPNKERARVRVEDAFVRSNLPLESPLSLLKARNTETPFWHEGRASFVRAIAGQRAVYRGLTALASANIDILPHQLTVVHRVLSDAVPRYLLADEVGLGKTIEAGLIIKQHMFDEPDRAMVLVAVPENLIAQWESELRDRIRLADSFQLQVVGHSELARCAEHHDDVTLLVIDEAHTVAQYACAGGAVDERYRAASSLAMRAEGVLLLSATPVLHNEDAFLGMLHLLDPNTHSLADLDGFRRRVAHRESVATAVRDLEDHATGFFIEPALKQLAPLAAISPQLADLVAEVMRLLDDDPDDRNRQQAIAALRAHLQECYRIDRRLLRTRRAQERVKDDLPCRKCELWELEDPLRLAMFEWLDQWRFNAAAADVEECRTTFMEFLEAGLAHPVVLAEEIDRRGVAIKCGATPLFADEAAFLETAPPVSVARDPRIASLISLLKGGPDKTKWVVFISHTVVADEVARAIASDGSVRAERLTDDATAVDTLARFRNDTGLTAVICDQSGEHGINLQGLNAEIVHFDLPLSPNRLEQRIGRLDRLNGDRKVVSHVPVIVGGEQFANFEAAWARCLMDAVGMFDRSVASLQHVLDVGHTRLCQDAVDGGVDAIDDLRDAWRASEGVLSLSRELSRVEAQDLIDQLDDDQSDFFEAIEALEYATDPSLAERFGNDVCGWAVRSLGFERYSQGEDDDGPIELEHTNHTLLSATHAARLFRDSLAYVRRRKGLSTGWMDFDRDRAIKSGIPLARIGHPFIEDLQRFTDWEDRGRAYACWRVIPQYEQRFNGAGPEDLFFRFDFVVKPDVQAVAEHAKRAGLSFGAVTRRAEEAFAPVFSTIWVDVDGDQVRNTELLKELSRPYGKHDTNLRDSRWAKVDDLGLVANWSRVCEQAEAAARRHLDQAIGLAEAVASAVRHVEERARRNALLLEARLAVSQTRTNERNALEVERKFTECLRMAIKDPQVRLDSVGALFVSGHNLFGG